MMRAAAAGCALLLVAPLSAQTPEPADARAAMARYQNANQRLQDVGWRLAHRNAAFCRETTPKIGLQLQDMASYANPAAARAALGLERDFMVASAARGSPAALSGEFEPGREIAGLDGFDPNLWPARPHSDWRRLARARDHITAMLVEHNGVSVTFADGVAARVEPVEVCAARFDLEAQGAVAAADDGRVVIGLDFPGMAYDEPLFAALVAHELAHILLGHDAWLDARGRSRRNIRLTEREADRLIPWLLANAGYDPAAGAAFMARRGAERKTGLRLERHHDSWDKRAQSVSAELPAITDLIAREGRADWAAHFRREIEITR
jgi:hypothetical protein